jgi:hypothetical protein
MSTEIFKCIAGSRLFGTANADSDLDMKAVHFPSTEAILLQTASAVITSSTGSNTTKNNASDADFVSFPVAKFLGMLAKMETNAVEMLFAPNLTPSPYWDMIYADRHKLLTNKRDCFLGFGKSQALRYAVRGDRIESLTQVCDILSSINPSFRVSVGEDVFSRLRAIPHVTITIKTEASGSETPYMEVFGRELSMYVRAGEALKVYQKPLKEAGMRTMQAHAAGGADWKGLYHAHRIVDEGTELLTTGELVFPLRNAQEYLSIRAGNLSLDEVLDTFDAKLKVLETAVAIPELKDAADMKWIESYILAAHEKVVVDAYFAWQEGIAG